MRLLTLISLVAFALTTWAQKTKPAPPTIDELIASYRLEEAQTQLKKEIQLATRRRKPTDALNRKLARVEFMLPFLRATQRITFIDSMVVARKDFFEHFALSEESGRITSYARTFRRRDTLSCTAFQPQLGNDAYYAMPRHNGSTHLCRSTTTLGDWGDDEPLPGLENDSTQNYPFLLGDGTTLYYGAINSNEGMGGYDIYTSRWDNDDKRFRQPENIGMPFNSPANDYMLAIDETSRLGWFVTDRRQPKDTVCIYIFIPAGIRSNWADTDTITTRQLTARAMLTRIADTQTDHTAVAEARARLNNVRRAARETSKPYDFTFPVADGKTYHFLSDFTNTDARELAAKWDDQLITLQVNERQLKSLRAQYATADDNRRSQLRAKILTLEREHEQQLEAIASLENTIRRKELGIKD
mgnify:CR=1 FL=1